MTDWKGYRKKRTDIQPPGQDSNPGSHKLGKGLLTTKT